MTLGACGGDSEDDSPAQRVDKACTSTCEDRVGGCGVPAPSADGCTSACKVGGALAADCAPQYEQYVTCAGDQPIVSCDESSITVSGSAVECLDPLAAYLVCAAEFVATACIPLPGQNAACQKAGLGPNAQACAATPDGCSLYEGTLRADGAGIFCCP
jgi:hypothetical protein